MRFRFKELRLLKNLSQEDFGNHLGVTKSTISNIETGRFNLTDSMVKLVCREFNVNEDWLRNGTGEMFVQHSAMDAYRRAADAICSGGHEMDRIVRGIITKYGDMDETSKDVFLNYLKDVASALEEKPRFEAPTQEELEREYISKIS